MRFVIVSPKPKSDNYDSARLKHLMHVFDKNLNSALYQIKYWNFLCRFSLVQSTIIVFISLAVNAFIFFTELG